MNFLYVDEKSFNLFLKDRSTMELKRSVADGAMAIRNAEDDKTRSILEAAMSLIINELIERELIGRRK